MSIPYLIYDKASGEILRWGACPSRRDVRGSLAGAPYRIAHATSSSHYLVGRKLVEYTPEQASRKAAAPDHPAAWSNTSMQWTDTRPPAAVYEAMLGRVRSQRNALLAESDVMLLRAIETGGLVPLALKVYRQALRDVTQQPDLAKVKWPTAPA